MKLSRFVGVSNGKLNNLNEINGFLGEKKRYAKNLKEIIPLFLQNVIRAIGVKQTSCQLLVLIK